MINNLRELNDKFRKKDREINKYIDENEKLLSRYENELKEEEIKFNNSKNDECEQIELLNKKIEEYEKTLNEKDKTILDLNEQINSIKKDSENSQTNSLKTSSKFRRLIENNIQNDIEITPESYELIKIVQYNRKLRWYLFKNKDIYKEENYNDFIWKEQKFRKEFSEFKSPNNNSMELQKQIENLEEKKKDLEDKLLKKESDYNRLSMNYAKLFNRKKNDNRDPDKLKSEIDKLKKENKILTNKINKYKEEGNVIGISFIEDDVEGPQFIDELNFDELIDNMSKAGIFTFVGDKKDYSSKQRLKRTVESLVSQIKFTQNVKLCLGSIFKQLKVSEDDIYDLIGKYRYVD